jgi:DNA topoisomerase-1
VYKGKKDAQDAHEAIRPTDVGRTPDSIAKYLSDEQLKLYRLIWQRFVASQMTPAIFDVTTAKIAAVSRTTKKTYDFRASGSVVRFDGFLKLYDMAQDTRSNGSDDEDESKAKLPSFDGVRRLELEKLGPEQHYTTPPPRYNEASLVKVLEERGIGRPSTYASIISTIQDREYVTKITGRFFPTEIGVVVNDLLVKNFPYIFDTQYTARLEEELDDIEEGKEKWTTLLTGFYDHFEDELVVADKKMENVKRWEKKTNEKCDICGSPLLLKWGKFGSFYACSAYNKKDPSSCTFTKENTANKPDLNTPEAQDAAEQEEYCENCGKVMVLRRGPFGMFLACPDYNADPPCKTFRKLTQKQQQKQSTPQPTGEDCPQCGKPLVLRQGAYGEFVSCSGYPKCKYVKQNIIEGMKCPKCGTGDIAERKAKRGNVFWGCTNYPKCDFTSNYKPVPTKCPECGSPYLLEKTLKSGIYLECPNKKKSAEEEAVMPKKKAKKGSEVEPQSAVVCQYSKRIGDPPPPPSPETHRPVLEKESKGELQPV